MCSRLWSSCHHFRREILQSLYIVILVFSPMMSQLTWIQPTSPVFPNGGDQRIVCGYYDGSVYLIGGDSQYYQVLEYKVEYTLYVAHSSVSDYIIAQSQQFTVIDDTIYIYGYEQLIDDVWTTEQYIMTYNMATNAYDNNAITKKNPNLLHPCITNINDGYINYILVVGGFTDIEQNTLQILDLQTSVWLNDGPTLITARSGHSCNIHKHELYTMGGYNAVDLNTVEILDVSDIADINSVEWIQLGAILSVARDNVRSVVHDDNIYVLGGNVCCNSCDKRCPSSSVDIIDTTTKTIVAGTDLQSGGVVSPVIVPAINTLFVFGGYVEGSGAVDTLQYTDMTPTESPTNTPTSSPTQQPTLEPTQSPTKTPTTHNPTIEPTYDPTLEPTISPTKKPTANPSVLPTVSPTLEPSVGPTLEPTVSPTNKPSSHPSIGPSRSPTAYPTLDPTQDPTFKVLDEWIYKDSLNCADGFRDLEEDNSWYGVYCERCEEGSAGTYGQCLQCGTLEEPNHTRTECDFSSPWWLYLIQTIGGLGFVIGIGAYIYNKVYPQTDIIEYEIDIEHKPINTVEMQQAKNIETHHELQTTCT